MKKINIEKIVNYIFIISSIIIVINLIIFSLKDKVFDIKNINIQNNEFIDKKELSQIIDDELKDKNLLNINISKLKNIINDHDFIQSSKIYTSYPSNLHIVINEITPIILFEQESKYYLYDYKKNKIEADIKAINYFPVPILVSDVKDNKIKNITNSLIKIFNKYHLLYYSISQIKINNEEIHYMTDKGTTIKLNLDNIDFHTQKLINFINQNQKKPIEKYEYVNLLIPNQIIVKEKSI